MKLRNAIKPPFYSGHEQSAECTVRNAADAVFLFVREMTVLMLLC